MNDKVKEKLEKKKKNDKKLDRKYLIIMLVLCAVCGVGGYFTGRFIGKLKKAGFKLPELTDETMGMLAIAMLIVFVAINVILAIVAICCISKSKKEWKLWDGEDEALAEKVESRVSVPIWMSSIVMILNMFLFAVCVNLDINSKFSDKIEDMYMLANLIVFVLSFVVVIVVQKKALDFTKEMNPEKEGSIFDVNFSKKWENSCDEAQKLQIYKAGSTGFKVMSTVCMDMWIVCLIADLFANVGLLPVTLVSVIWLSGNIGYLVGGIKAEKEMNIGE